LPPTDRVAPHYTSWFGVLRDRGSSPHRGIDFNYVGGQTGINLTHPEVHSPISGTVISVGGDPYNTISIRDSNGFVHNTLHTQSQFVRPGQQVTAGQVIATMGGVGADDFQHVHYGMRDPAGALINPADYWSGKFGVTPPVLPAPPIPYLKPSLAAEQELGTMSWLKPGNPSGSAAPLDLRPPTQLNSQGSSGPVEVPPSILPPLHFAPSPPPPSFGPFTLPDNSGGSGNEAPQPQPLNLQTPLGWPTASLPRIMTRASTTPEGSPELRDRRCPAALRRITRPLGLALMRQAIRRLRSPPTSAPAASAQHRMWRCRMPVRNTGGGIPPTDSFAHGSETMPLPAVVMIRPRNGLGMCLAPPRALRRQTCFRHSTTGLETGLHRLEALLRLTRVKRRPARPAGI